MLGFSLSKLLVLAILIAVVWYGFKLAGRMGRTRLRGTGTDDSPPGTPRIEDMTRCCVCGVFVPAAGARDCGRAGCPYPG
jgi:hypothetical protein